MAALQYVGSKFTLAPSIRPLLEAKWGDLREWTLVDAFFGAGGFTLVCGSLFKDAVLNDLELYAVQLAHALFVEPLPLPEHLEPISGYITRSYSSAGPEGRLFFSPHNARTIDAYREWLRQQPDTPARASAVGQLLSSLDRRANHASTYQAYLKAEKATSRVPIAFRNLFRGAEDPLVGKVTITQGCAQDAAADAPEQSVLYLDPPYTSLPYSRMYFVLNVIGELDEDPVLKGVTGRPPAMNKSAWNSKHGALGELKQLLAGTRARRVVMSYSTDGIMSEADIHSAFTEAGFGVEVHRLPKTRYRTIRPDAVNINTTVLEELVFMAAR
jgi:adenine-specific DNA-methyltransferase